MPNICENLIQDPNQASCSLSRQDKVTKGGRRLRQSKKTQFDQQNSKETDLSQSSLPGPTNKRKNGKRLPKSGGKRGRRGRKSTGTDVHSKLERSRQSARECRIRKKLRYQYLESLVEKTEKSVLALRKELEWVS